MSEINIASISDIHLGAKRTPTSHIVKNLYEAFPDNAETSKLDLITLAGDVFDGLLKLPDDEIREIERWIVYLLRLCKKHNIVLRVLEGTPSHDWKQSIRFVILNEATQIDCDLKYVDQLAIEYIPSLDINVLYVPDEWNDSTEKTYSQVCELMTLKGITKVDYAFMHGQFEYQLPDIVKAPKHSAEKYLSIVDKLIFIGHVHVFSRYDRIIAQGSFDRLSHGEEGAKGHVRACVRSNTDYEIRFVENKGARIYVTIECVGLSLEETLKTVENRLKDIPDGSCVRVSCLPDNPILTNMDQLVMKWPFITFSKIIRETDLETKAAEVDEFTELEFIPITITRDNIVTLVMDRLLNLESPTESKARVQLHARAEEFMIEMR